MVTENNEMKQASEQIAKEIKQAASQNDVESIRKKTEDGIFVATHCHNEEDRTSAFCEALNYLPSMGTIMKTVGVGALLYGAARVMNEAGNSLSQPMDLASENGPSNLAVDMEIFQTSGPVQKQEGFDEKSFIQPESDSTYRNLRTHDLDTSKSWTDQAGEDLSVSKPENFLKDFDEQNLVQEISTAESPWTRAPSQSPTNSAPTGYPSYVDNHPDFRAPTPAPSPPGPEELSDGAIVGISIASLVAVSAAAYCGARQCAKGSAAASSHEQVAQGERQMTQL